MRGDYAKHRNVAETFYRHTREAVHESGLPVLEVTDDRQRGCGFGPRLANAVSDAFAAGYEHVIVVGNDCPSLHEVEFGEVAKHLSEGTPVLGPTADGKGAYLIGLSRDHFSRDDFEALPWQESTLLSALEQHLAHYAGRAVGLLQPRSDVNGHRDLVALLHSATHIPAFLACHLRQVLGRNGRASRVEERSESRRERPRRPRAPPRGFVASNQRVSSP